MDGWADSSGRRALLWPHTAACLSVTLYLPASSAKYFKRGEGREKFITNQTTRKKQCLGREEKTVIRLLLGFLIKSASFPFPTKHTAYAQGRAKTKPTSTI